MLVIWTSLLEETRPKKYLLLVKGSSALYSVVKYGVDLDLVALDITFEVSKGLAH